MQAGTSSSRKCFAAKNAEAIFVAGHSPSVVAKSVKNIRAQAKEFGRDEKSIKFLAMICPVLAETEDEARAKYEEYLSYGSEDAAFALFGG
jgi:alkanesulfonate monooxygenase SsuD/methylene tetrahydromethanopterin reductase-like flavin-dependent oxidoreductase (luciferase family)